MDLTQFQWKNRLLFLFAPDRKNPPFKDLQTEIIAQKTEVQDRDLVVFEVLERDPSRMNTAPIDPEGADALRDRFRVPPNTFSLILVGKDGGIKLKRHEKGNLREIFDLIDSMPMRQNEMRQKNQ
ncbi:MAG: DUF4174 domain-containing protein [Desulfobacterales bacterium]